jgi:hypothetical protein
VGGKEPTPVAGTVGALARGAAGAVDLSLKRTPRIPGGYPVRPYVYLGSHAPKTDSSLREFDV